jgi:hypothetical protein
MSKSVLAMSIAVAVAIGSGGCERPERPGVEAWEAAWQHTAALLPDATAFRDGDPRVRCDETLAALRSARKGILPTPDAALDGAVRQWFDLAESAVYDCDPTEGAAGTFEERLSETKILRDEVRAALADLRPRR